ncbi:MAG: AAA family ATPase [Bacteroidia bacterium]|nr:AAA family ATPase [Bacteroidia bacterium]
MIRDRIAQLLTHMGHNLFEKERVLAMALLSAVAGESIFLLGPPGVAKSMVARRLKLAFSHAKAFEYLMGKFSTPDEVFGPVSISRLKNDDKYERITEFYLPGAQIVFLDEIWKASPPIQNALLTVLNEKIYRNGEQEVKVDIRGLIAASNELPAQGEGLEALWDRFLIRLVVEGIETEDKFEALLSLPNKRSKEDLVPEALRITDEEYKSWQTSIDSIDLPPHLLGLIHEIRRMIRNRNATADPDQQWYVSDRRWRKVANLLRCSAFLHDRRSVILADMFLLVDCLWDRYEQRKEMQDLLTGAIVRHGYERLTKLGSLRAQLDMWREEITEETRMVKVREVTQPKAARDEEGVTYFQLLKYRGDEPVFVKEEDWDQMNTGQERIFPLFDRKEGIYRAIQRTGARKTEDGGLKISGKEYQILMEQVEEKQIIPKNPHASQITMWNQQASILMRGCQERLERLEQQYEEEKNHIRSHLFLDQDFAPHIEQAYAFAKRQILDLKLDTQKTQHSYEEVGDS